MHIPRDMRVSDAAEYGRVGFVVELMFYDGHWAIPAWEEMGFASLAHTFATRESAMREIASYYR